MGRGLMPATDAPLPEQTFDMRASAPAVPAPTQAAAKRAPSRPVARPTHVRISDIGIDAPVRPETVSPDGELVIPGHVGTLGWWAPGDGTSKDDPAGDLVLAGHVDMNGDLGALHDLSQVKPGAEVVLTGEDGHEETWQIEALEVRHKNALPQFTAEGDRRLALVTCGGPVIHDAHGRGYRDNVIAWARPAT